MRNESRELFEPGHEALRERAAGSQLHAESAISDQIPRRTQEAKKPKKLFSGELGSWEVGELGVRGTALHVGTAQTKAVSHEPSANWWPKFVLLPGFVGVLVRAYMQLGLRKPQMLSSPGRFLGQAGALLEGAEGLVCKTCFGRVLPIRVGLTSVGRRS